MRVVTVSEIWVRAHVRLPSAPSHKPYHELLARHSPDLIEPLYFVSFSQDECKVLEIQSSCRRSTEVQLNPMMQAAEQVDLLRRQYLQTLSPEELTLPCKELLRLPEIQANIYESLFNSSSIAHLSLHRYRFRVLKRLMDALEQAIVDPEEDVCLPKSFLCS